MALNGCMDFGMFNTNEMTRSLGFSKFLSKFLLKNQSMPKGRAKVLAKREYQQMRNCPQKVYPKKRKSEHLLDACSSDSTSLPDPDDQSGNCCKKEPEPEPEKPEEPEKPPPKDEPKKCPCPCTPECPPTCSELELPSFPFGAQKRKPEAPMPGIGPDDDDDDDSSADNDSETEESSMEASCQNKEQETDQIMDTTDESNEVDSAGSETSDQETCKDSDDMQATDNVSTWNSTFHDETKTSKIRHLGSTRSQLNQAYDRRNTKRNTTAISRVKNKRVNDNSAVNKLNNGTAKNTRGNLREKSMTAKSALNKRNNFGAKNMRSNLRETGTAAKSAVNKRNNRTATNTRSNFKETSLANKSAVNKRNNTTARNMRKKFNEMDSPTTKSTLNKSNKTTATTMPSSLKGKNGNDKRVENKICTYTTSQGSLSNYDSTDLYDASNDTTESMDIDESTSSNVDALFIPDNEPSNSINNFVPREHLGDLTSSGGHEVAFPNLANSSAMETGPTNNEENKNWKSDGLLNFFRRVILQETCNALNNIGLLSPGYTNWSLDDAGSLGSTSSSFDMWNRASSSVLSDGDFISGSITDHSMQNDSEAGYVELDKTDNSSADNKAGAIECQKSSTMKNKLAFESSKELQNINENFRSSATQRNKSPSSTYAKQAERNVTYVMPVQKPKECKDRQSQAPTICIGSPFSDPLNRIPIRIIRRQ